MGIEEVTDGCIGSGAGGSGGGGALAMTGKLLLLAATGASGGAGTGGGAAGKGSVKTGDELVAPVALDRKIGSDSCALETAPDPVGAGGLGPTALD